MIHKSVFYSKYRKTPKTEFCSRISYKQNNQKFICQRLKGVNNAGYIKNLNIEYQ
jgi:hypothetical protein